MVDDVQFARLERALKERKESHPNEDTEISFKMACRQLGITKKEMRDQCWQRLSNANQLRLSSVWRSRGRPKYSYGDLAAGAEVEDRRDAS